MSFPQTAYKQCLAYNNLSSVPTHSPHAAALTDLRGYAGPKAPGFSNESASGSSSTDGTPLSKSGLSTGESLRDKRILQRFLNECCLRNRGLIIATVLRVSITYRATRIKSSELDYPRYHRSSRQKCDDQAPRDLNHPATAPRRSLHDSMESCTWKRVSGAVENRLLELSTSHMVRILPRKLVSDPRHQGDFIIGDSGMIQRKE